VGFLGEEFSALAGAVGVAGKGEDLGVVDEPVDHRGGGNVVGEGFGPSARTTGRSDEYRSLFVA
jgi:hypothetical protein